MSKEDEVKKMLAEQEKLTAELVRNPSALNDEGFRVQVAKLFLGAVVLLELLAGKGPEGA